jgi:hypothetical protein
VLVHDATHNRLCLDGQPDGSAAHGGVHPTGNDQERRRAGRDRRHCAAATGEHRQRRREGPRRVSARRAQAGGYENTGVELIARDSVKGVPSKDEAFGVRNLLGLTAPGGGMAGDFPGMVVATAPVFQSSPADADT